MSLVVVVDSSEVSRSDTSRTSKGKKSKSKPATNSGKMRKNKDKSSEEDIVEVLPDEDEYRRVLEELKLDESDMEEIWNEVIVIQEVVNLPENVRTRYYFDQSFEAKIQTYFKITDPKLLKVLSSNQYYQVGCEKTIKANVKMQTRSDVQSGVKKSEPKPKKNKNSNKKKKGDVPKEDKLPEAEPKVSDKKKGKTSAELKEAKETSQCEVPTGEAVRSCEEGKENNDVSTGEEPKEEEIKGESDVQKGAANETEQETEKDVTEEKKELNHDIEKGRRNKKCH